MLVHFLRTGAQTNPPFPEVSQDAPEEMLLETGPVYLNKGSADQLVRGINYSYLIDPRGELSIDDVVDMRFHAHASEADLDEAFQADVVWVKFVVQNLSDASLSGYLLWEPNGYAYIFEDED